MGRENVEGLNEQDVNKQVQELLNSSESRRINPRKRPAVGHTPFDLANCQKVRYANYRVIVTVYAAVLSCTNAALLYRLEICWIVQSRVTFHPKRQKRALKMVSKIPAASLAFFIKPF